MERLILATDMSRHAEFSTALRAEIDRGRALAPAGLAGPEAAVDPERGLLLELLIKAADSSNVLRPFPVAKRWAVSCHNYIPCVPLPSLQTTDRPRPRRWGGRREGRGGARR